MIQAEFEESEFRGPLYNQLEIGNNLVWEPGQVFEKKIGIDRASYVTNPLFWNMHCHPIPMQGAVLREYKWDWEDRNKKKVLPDFKLNLFLQVKRPHASKYPKGEVKKSGLVGNYWRFKVTPHQQFALEKMSSALSSSALVCYASPAFHTQDDLYEHTKYKSIVSASTFPPVDKLTGHGAWYYQKGGRFGVANPDFVRIKVEPLEDQIISLVKQHREQRQEAAQTLKNLAEKLISSTSERLEPSVEDNFFQLQLQKLEDMLETMVEVVERDEEMLASMRHFWQIRAFCNAYQLDWFVLGESK